MSSPKKSIFFCLPPTGLYMPSISLEVLRGHLHRNGFESNIKYLNIAFNEIINDFKSCQSKDESTIMLPFLAMIAELYQDDAVKNRIASHLYSLKPFYRILKNKIFEKELESMKKAILEIIRNELSNIDTTEVLVFGLSAKFEQWVPGIILARQLKEKFPNIKIVIGGFESESIASEFGKIFDIFDFLVWGEGEDPLLELVKKLDKNEVNYNEIPRLIYKENNQLILSTITKLQDQKFEFTDYCQLDYGSYKDSNFFQENINNISFPLELSRGCHWNRCNFCVLNMGYHFKRRSNESLVEEIERLYNTYGVKSFFFVDNDIIARDFDEFEKLMDELILSSERNNCNFTFHADLIHNKLNSSLIKKMAMAGFKSIQIGYEGVSDNMLKKLNKSTRFAQNILFIKFAYLYGIDPIITGVIIGLPNEVESDILECIENLHFLRFQLSENKFKHNFAKLYLYNGTKFYKMMNETQIAAFNYNPTNYFLPEKLIPKKLGFELMGYTKEPDYILEWENFDSVSKSYNDSKFYYYLYEHKGIPHYEEYKDDKIINKIVFDDPLYWDILSGANHQVCKIGNLFEKLSGKYKYLTIDSLQHALEELREESLLYHNDSFSQIVTIINTDQLS